MDPALNPFKPGSGRTPPALEGRVDQLEAFDLLIARSKNRNYDRGMMLSGLRGVGKTTLLNTLSEHADRQGWLTVSVEARESEVAGQLVRQRLARETHAGLRRFSNKHRLAQVFQPALELVRNLSIKVSAGPAGATVEITPGSRQGPSINDIDWELDLSEAIEEICAKLKPKGSAFGLFIDEMQDLDEHTLGALLTIQHTASQRDWPFFIIGAGLPNLPGRLADCRSYAERQFLYNTIGALSPADATDALRIPITEMGGSLTDEAVGLLVASSEGYPYFLQEHGKAIWDAAPATPFTLADAEVAVEIGRIALDDGFFPSRWDRTAPKERRYLRAMAELSDPAPRSGTVAAHMGSVTSGVSEVRDSLIKKGLIWPPEHGRVAFTVPGMNDFIRRQPTE